jgi:hypothetical protein
VAGYFGGGVMSEDRSGPFQWIDPEDPSTADLNALQGALKRGERSYEMLMKILDVMKAEVEHRGMSTPMTPEDMLNKMVGLAHEFDLPEIREKALDYQKTSR